MNMRYISKNLEWFCSQEGLNCLEKAVNLEERIDFIYNYLVSICKNNQTDYEEIAVFKIAFLLSDAISKSNLEYTQNDKILDDQINPFVAFINNANTIHDDGTLGLLLLSILHEIANPFLKNDWIYDEKYNDYNVLVEHLEQLDHKFDSGSIMLVDTKAFETDKEKELIQLEIIWLFCVEE